MTVLLISMISKSDTGITCLVMEFWRSSVASPRIN